ncbi:MAG: very short patch repair endonuclease [Deltaproteobacteria bacterium]|nr:very short patch repair endonuclease [Deltaproteobacteria bacterium]
MVDRISKEHRSWNMSRIPGKDTKPEKIVRSVLHKAGYRFRLNFDRVPGKPDIVLPKHKLAIFVHGCFWHRHPNCKYAYTPKSRISFWQSKFAKNIERDRIVKSELESLGWNVLIIWECQTKDSETILSIFEKYLGMIN